MDVEIQIPKQVQQTYKFLKKEWLIKAQEILSVRNMMQKGIY